MVNPIQVTYFASNLDYARVNPKLNPTENILFRDTLFCSKVHPQQK